MPRGRQRQGKIRGSDAQFQRMQPTPCTEFTDMTDSAPDQTDDAIHEDRLWRDDGWTARVIKNEDDDGWAVEMIKDGEAEPALVGPWTMGRDKKNPKPLDAAAFRTLVKTASEVLRRHEQQRHAMLHKNVTVERARRGGDGHARHRSRRRRSLCRSQGVRCVRRAARAGARVGGDSS